MAVPYRDRLDEIIADELNGTLIPVKADWSGSVIPATKAITTKIRHMAERVFRHGVEQHIAYVRGDLATETASRVQPAPAEGGCACGCNDRWAHQQISYNERDWLAYMSGTGDRRKGERRQALPEETKTVHELGTIKFRDMFRSGYSWFFERRQSDRRQ